MGISFVNLTSATGTDVSGTCAAPSGLANNDILVLWVYKENANTPTYPSGFSEFAAVTASDSSFTLYGAWKRAASESGSYVTSWTGSVFYRMELLAYRGAITSGDPQDATAVSQANGSQNNVISVPSITTATDNAMVVIQGAASVGMGGASTPPAGYTERFDTGAVSVSDAIKALAGATGASSVTHGSGTSQTAAIIMALRSAGEPSGGVGAGSFAIADCCKMFSSFYGQSYGSSQRWQWQPGYDTAHDPDPPIMLLDPPPVGGIIGPLIDGRLVKRGILQGRLLKG